MFEQVTRDDKQAFLDLQREIHGDKFPIPSLDESPSYGQSFTNASPTNMFAVYREAMGAPKEITLSTSVKVIVAPPKVKTLKYLLAKAEELGTIADTNPIGVFDELEKIMLQCLEFPNGTPADVAEWFGDLPGDDGMLLAETFAQVFDIKFLMQRANLLKGKN